MRLEPAQPRASAGTVPQPAAAARQLRRSPERGLLGGICVALGERLGIDPVLPRLAFVAAGLAGGAGVVFYLLAWMLVPTAHLDAAARSTLRSRRATWHITVGAGLLTVSGLLLLRALRLWPGDAIVWPAFVAVSGALLIWHASSGLPGLAVRRESAGGRASATLPDAKPRRAERVEPAAAPPAGDAPGLSHGAAHSRIARALRASAVGGRAMGKVGVGASLVLGAGLLFLWANGAAGKVGSAVLTAVVMVVALTLILAPLWVRFLRSLTAERAERVRSQERTAVAAHLHDSVLQTLALIQRRAQEPREVAALARRQERELRNWLSDRGRAQTGTTITQAIQDVATDVEVTHGVLVEVVIVGARALDEAGEAVVAAAREAMLNAAKFACGSPIAVYAELTRDRVHVFIRDRGPGFEPELVPADRRGLRDSIMGRMRHCGGCATVRSTPGEGTEVELSLRQAVRA